MPTNDVTQALPTTHNPDVLSCLANLSNDEVFTPPALVNQILDGLPADLWQNPEATFLDPVCKSGVFLREIAKRLMAGLESLMPDVEERANHVFTRQLYGLAITELTGLLSRRSVYGSKTANGEYSLCSAFDDEQGHIQHRRVPHTWTAAGKCSYCGASQEVYDRDDALETYAYPFIHTQKPEELFKMKFDVIVGNPPYQLDTGGSGRQAKPLYQLFVQQAKKLNPRFITMIIPSRWFAGGMGLSEFRQEMLADEQLSKLVDFIDARDCFPSVDIAGGVCYFLWEKGHVGPCEVTNNYRSGNSTSLRRLNEFQTFIRFEAAASIVKKVQAQNEASLTQIISSTRPFGLTTKDRPSKSGRLILVSSGGSGPLDSSRVTTGKELVDKWKVMTSKASHDHGGQPDAEGKRRVLSRVEILPPKTVCTESYILLGSFDSEEEAKNCKTYVSTRFVRFLTALLSFSQDITRERFGYVPIQNFSESWTDEKLYKKYGITDDEVAFIESMIRPMDLAKPAPDEEAINPE